MKLMIVRHGDPDYEHDSLTPKGWKEAGLLADRLSKISVRAFYCSPLGRARDTASVTLKRMGREATVCNWLQEFPASIIRPDSGKRGIAWDLLPGFWTKRRILYDKDGWYHDPVMETGNVQEFYRAVTDGFDAVLSQYGYERSGMCYRVSVENRDTLVFFCHLGVGCTMIGHLLGIPAPECQANGQSWCSQHQDGRKRQAYHGFQPKPGSTCRNVHIHTVTKPHQSHRLPPGKIPAHSRSP